jgi:putative transposase
MRAAGIAGVSRRRSAPITRRQATDHHPASDLVRRNFMAERPNELWVADIIFLPTLAGFLYLAMILDAWSHRVVGWAFSADLKTRIVLDALDIALVARKPDNVVHHSAPNIRRSLSALAARKPAFVHRQARSATPTTVRVSVLPGEPDPAYD